MVFHSYVSLPEGIPNTDNSLQAYWIVIQADSFQLCSIWPSANWGNRGPKRISSTVTMMFFPIISRFPTLSTSFNHYGRALPYTFNYWRSPFRNMKPSPSPTWPSLPANGMEKPRLRAVKSLGSGIFGRAGHFQNVHIFTRWCPSSLAKLVQISPITMVYGRYNCSGFINPLITGGHHPVGKSW